jgi:NH3-dependent NAD+ synthetase
VGYADNNGLYPFAPLHNQKTHFCKEFIDARPSAELTPLSAGEQDDESEAEMGLTYDELSTFGVLRKVICS